MLIQANELNRQGDYQGALDLYLQALERFGQRADLLAAIARSHYDLAFHDPHTAGEGYREAVAWMKRAIALAPDDAQLHNTLADYYALDLLDYEQAAQEYRKVLEINPCYVYALVSAAALYGVPEEVVSLDEAIDWLERATHIDPDQPWYHGRLGSLYHEAGRTLEAQREWIKALLSPRPLDPGYVSAIKKALGLEDG